MSRRRSKPLANLVGRQGRVVDADLVDRALEVVAVTAAVLPAAEGESLFARASRPVDPHFAARLAVLKQPKQGAVIRHRQVVPGLGVEPGVRRHSKGVVAAAADVESGLRHAVLDADAVVAICLLVIILAGEPGVGLRRRVEIGERVDPAFEREMRLVDLLRVGHVDVVATVETEATAHSSEAGFARADRRESGTGREKQRQPVGPGDRLEPRLDVERGSVGRGEHEPIHIGPGEPAAGLDEPRACDAIPWAARGAAVGRAARPHEETEFSRRQPRNLGGIAPDSRSIRGRLDRPHVWHGHRSRVEHERMAAGADATVPGSFGDAVRKAMEPGDDAVVVRPRPGFGGEGRLCLRVGGSR